MFKIRVSDAPDALPAIDESCACELAHTRGLEQFRYS